MDEQAQTELGQTESPPTELEWNRASAETAYSVIAHYAEHAQITGLLIAMLASELGEERLKPLAQSEAWQMYMASKRTLENARRDVEALTRLIERTRKQESPSKES